MAFIDFDTIVRHAWLAYDSSRKIQRITDISAKVSTNHVYKVTLEDRSFIIAKLSYFGKYEHFVEDHTIINSLSNNLPAPYENLLARSLVKGNSIFVHRFQSGVIDAWVVFYRPIKIKTKLPRRLEVPQIEKLGREIAHFHKACDTIRNTLPAASKSLSTDLRHLLEFLETDLGKYEHRMMTDVIREQCDRCLQNLADLDTSDLHTIPVFVDWNIGNFSVTSRFKLFSRWDYDWFRMSSRIMDFYFFSRVVSDIGDRTAFSYWIDPMTEERFMIFLENYHAIFPLTVKEILLLKEAYRFFILNYVIKDGRYFFHEIFASKLQQEAYTNYLPSVETFDAERIIKKLNL